MSTETDDNDVDDAVRHMIDMADELLTLTSDENRKLAVGLPASLDDIVFRKQELAAEFESLLGQVKIQQDLLVNADPDLTASLLERNRRLKDVLAENADRLRIAMAASKRRVDAIMRAIREENAPPTSYGKNGRYRVAGTSKPMSLGPGCKA